MERISSLIARAEYNQCPKLCQQLELQSAMGDITLPLSQIYLVYLASLILTDNLQEARYVRKRIHTSHSNTPEIDALWSVTAALITHSYPAVYQRLSMYQWSDYIQPLMMSIQHKIRHDISVMLSNTYVSIQFEQCCDYFGLTDNEVLEVLNSLGWKYDQSNKIVYPVKLATDHRMNNNVQFEELADIVLNLEKF